MSEFDATELDREIFLKVRIPVFGKHEDCARIALKVMKELELLIQKNITLQECYWMVKAGDGSYVLVHWDTYKSIEELKAAFPEIVAKMRLL